MKRILFIAVAIFFAATTFGQTQLPNDPAVKVGKLENGLTYYILHNEKPAQRAEFYLATNAGAIQETLDQDGLAHFLEHMCFNGTKNYPGKELLNYLQSIGAEFGRNINASTGVEQTVYMLNNMPVTREGIIDSCLLVMHDYSHFVTCDPVEIDKERGVIIEERRTRRDANWRIREKSLPIMYGDSKYGTCSLIGSQENLETFKPESLVSFYKTWYRPDLQALIVVGDVDVDQIEAKIQKLFSDIPKVENPKPKDVHMIPSHEEPLIGVFTDPELTANNIQILWKSDAMPKEFNSTDIGMLTNLAKSIIYYVMEERYNDIASKPGAPFFSSFLGIGNICNTCEAVIGTVNFKSGEYEKAFTEFLKEYEKAKRYGFTEGEVQRAKDKIIAEYENAAKSAESRTNASLVYPLINNFFDNQPYMVPQQEFELVKLMLQQLPTNAINQIIKGVFKDENISIIYKATEKEGVIHPTAEQLTTILENSRTMEVEANANEEVLEDLVDADAIKASKVKKESKGIYGSTVWTFKNGLKVVVLPTDYKKDQIIMSSWMNGGESLIADEAMPSFEDNVYGLFNRNSGISKFKSTQLAKILAGKNVSVSTSIDDITHGITANTTPKDLETALQLVYLSFMDPRFDPEEFQIGVDQIKAVLPSLEANPSYILQKRISNTVFGETPRMPVLGLEQLEKANIETIEKEYRKLFSDVSGMTMVFVGDIDIAVLKPLCEKYLGSLPKGKKNKTWKDNTPQPRKGEIIDHFKIDMETPKNTVIQFYSANIPYTVEAAVNLQVANNILDMIYTETLREEEGGTYGASCRISLDREPVSMASIQVFFETNPTLNEKLRQLAIDGLKKLAYEGPTDEQLKRAVENFKKNIPEKKINNSFWMGAITNNCKYNIDYVKEYEAAADSISAEEIKSLLQSILEQGNFIEIMMAPDKSAERE